MSQLLSQICLEGEEFVRFSSPVMVTIRKNLELEIIKKYITHKDFLSFLNLVLIGEHVTLELDEKEANFIKDFIEYFNGIGNKNFRIVAKNKILAINYCSEKKPHEFAIKNETFLALEGQGTDLNKETLFIVKEISSAFQEKISNEAIRMKLDLIIHEYSTIVKNGKSKKIHSEKGLNMVDFRYVIFFKKCQNLWSQKF